MSATLLDVTAVRARFTALQRRLAFFDGPGGTQCPDEVIDAIAGYLRHDNANVGAPYETSRRTSALVDLAHEKAGSFLGCSGDEVAFGQSMTSLNFLLTRALARELEAGDEVLVTKLDHDGNVAPWLALQEDLGIVVRWVDVHDDLSLDYDSLESQLSDRTRVVAFPVAANSVGTAPDVRRIVELAHGAGALAWADAVHYGPHGPIDVAAWDVDVLLCSPYKFYGPHMGMAFGKKELLGVVAARTRCARPPTSRWGTATSSARASTSCSRASSPPSTTSTRSAGTRCSPTSAALGQRFLDGLPDGVDLYGLPTMEGRVPTFCFNVPGRTSEEVATHLADEHEVAVWWGNYYALETMRRLGLDEWMGAVRAGIVHYNTEEEVDRLLAGVAELL